MLRWHADPRLLIEPYRSSAELTAIHERRWMKRIQPSSVRPMTYSIVAARNAFHLVQLRRRDARHLMAHVVKSIEDTPPASNSRPCPRRVPDQLEAGHDSRRARGDVDVNITGTGRWAFAGAPYKVAGRPVRRRCGDQAE